MKAAFCIFTASKKVSSAGLALRQSLSLIYIKSTLMLDQLGANQFKLRDSIIRQTAFVEQNFSIVLMADQVGLNLGTDVSTTGL